LLAQIQAKRADFHEVIDRAVAASGLAKTSKRSLSFRGKQGSFMKSLSKRAVESESFNASGSICFPMAAEDSILEVPPGLQEIHDD